MIFVFLSMTISMSTHVTVSGIISSFFMADPYSIVYMYSVFFIHSSISGHLGCFSVLAIVYNAAMNTEVQVSFQIVVVSRYMPKSGVGGLYGSSTFSFKRFIYLLSYFLDCAGSVLLHMAFSSCSEWGLFSVSACGFSLPWILLLQSTGSWCSGFRSCST